MTVLAFIRSSLVEDIGNGDHTSLACIPDKSQGKAALECREKGIIAGIKIAKIIFHEVDPTLIFEQFIEEGRRIAPGDIALTIAGNARFILMSERLVLNCMQRMSGIATFTNKVVQQLEGLPVKLLDTRKTTPGIRLLEKHAVKVGGVNNHRFGLFDMIMIKDNHIDYAGGITQAISAANKYRKKKNLNIQIEIEARNMEEVKEILKSEGVDRIMLDNFNIANTKKAVELINGKIEIESSGNINLDNIRQYAKCGINYISMGALTNSVKSMDLGLKALK